MVVVVFFEESKVRHVRDSEVSEAVASYGLVVGEIAKQKSVRLSSSGFVEQQHQFTYMEILLGKMI